MHGGTPASVIMSRNSLVGFTLLKSVPRSDSGTYIARGLMKK
jgi:hypothetical protein